MLGHFEMREMVFSPNLAEETGARHLTQSLFLGLAGFVPHDAADRCPTDSSGGTAARENVTCDAPDGGTDRGVILLRCHGAATAEH
jgi:hypothetical protein